MKNPWINLLHKSPYVLKDDHKAILEFNKNRSIEHQFFLDDFPVPFTGDVKKAKVVLLQLNPGLEMPPGLSDPSIEIEVFSEYKEDSIKNIKQEEMSYPFICLNPKHRLTGSFRYWAKVFSKLIKEPSDYKKIAKNVCCIEFFPYHSKKFSPLRSILNCQDYNFYLVEQAIKRKALIIIMKGEKDYWLKNMPNLKDYPFKTLNSINSMLSERNLGKKNFVLLKECLME